MKCSDFKVNEAWIACKVNNNPILLEEGPHNIYFIIEASSAYVIKQVTASSKHSSPELTKIKLIFNDALIKSKEWPSKLFIDDDIPTQNNFYVVAQSLGIKVERESKSAMSKIIDPVIIDITNNFLNNYEEADDSLDENDISSDLMSNLKKSFLSSYYKEWLDNDIPCLNNASPREASKTKEGIVLLEKLFKDMNSPDVSDDLRPDVSKIRKALNI